MEFHTTRDGEGDSKARYLYEVKGACRVLGAEVAEVAGMRATVDSSPAAALACG
jgi:hypothetical protein